MSSFQFSHGGYPRSEGAKGMRALDVRGPFAYMFPNLANDSNSLLPVSNNTAAQLSALAQAMSEPSDTAGANSNIPPVYTYWGQFIDHDVTVANQSALPGGGDILDDGFAPIAPDVIASSVVNGRRAIFDLDSVYGDGPGTDALGNPTEAQELGFYLDDGVRLRVGTVSSGPGEVPNAHLGLDRDLPRNGGGQRAEAGERFPLIGDTRNDENTIVAQFHLGWIRFHNAVADWVEANENKTGDELFQRARSIVRNTYQWLVLHDYLKAVTMYGTVDRVLYGGNRFYDPGSIPGLPMMPLEFAVAAYRFGHSMVRSEYDFNVNFGRENTLATFAQMFQFTGRGGMFGLPTLPHNWIADWERLTNHGSSDPNRFARKIDTHLSFELANMQNELPRDGEPSLNAMQSSIIVHLAQRNLLRGYQFSIPTGQAIADAMGITPLTADEMQVGNSAAVNDALAAGGFLDKTPLWYYILKEGEVHANGNSLGQLGSEIIVETIVGLMRTDPGNVVNSGWTPEQGVKFPEGTPVVTIRDVFRFAGVM